MMAVPVSLKQRLKTKNNLKSTEVVLPAVEDSKRVEIAYRRDLNRLINQMTKEVRQVLVPVAKEATKENLKELKKVTDSVQTDKILLALNSIKMKYQNEINRYAVKTATDFVADNVMTNVRKFRTSLNAVSEVSLKNIIEDEFLDTVISASIETNVSLIKSIPTQYFDKLEYTLMQNLTDPNFKIGGLTKEIQNLTGVTKRRAKTIARDQNSKVNASITQTRQTELGIKKYVWQTSGDERVRASHRNNNGKVFFWNKPNPTTGHPSHDVNCRCVALPVVDLSKF